MDVTEAALIRHRVNWSGCTLCTLARHRKQVVLHRFGPDSIKQGIDILFLGEAPGVSEDTLGKPFVPRAPAGKNLEIIISQVSEDYRPFTWAITNVVACHPPQNRDPDRDECAACNPRLVEFLAIIQPLLVVTVGTVPKQSFSPENAVKTLKKNGYPNADFHTCGIPHTAHIARKLSGGDPSAHKDLLDAASQINGSLRHAETLHTKIKGSW